MFLGKFRLTTYFFLNKLKLPQTPKTVKLHLELLLWCDFWVYSQNRLLVSTVSLYAHAAFIPV